MLKIFLKILLIFVIFVPGSGQIAAAQDRHWEFAGWEGGGCFPNIEPDPQVKGRVYLASDVSGLWRSDDSGEHWQFATKGLKSLLVAAVTASPSDPNRVYAATGAGIFVSANAGMSWNAAGNLPKNVKFQRPQNYRPIAVAPKDPLDLCVASQKGEVFCSKDAGKTWNNIANSQLENLAFLLYDSSGKKLLAGGTSGFQIFDLASQKWSPIAVELKDLSDLWISPIDPQKFYAAADGELWISNDAGSSWQKAAGKHQGKIFRLAVTSDKKPRLFAAVNDGWNGRVLVSDDEGATWNNSVKSISPDRKADPTRSWTNASGKLTALKADPLDSQVIYRADWWGVYRSDDGGKTWNEKIHGAPNTVVSDIQVTSDAVLVASMDNGLLKSSDEGKIYSPLFPSDRWDSAKAGHVWRVIAPAPRKIVATSSPWGERIDQVIVSGDGGGTFKIIHNGLPAQRPMKNTMWGQGYPRGLAFDPADPNRIYLGIDGDDGGGLFISEDGGLSWARSPGQPGSLRIYNALAVDPTDSKRIFWGACGKGGGVYVSVDQGKTWRQTFKQISWVFDLAVASDGRVYAAGDYSGNAGVYISKDHGETWQRAKNASAKGAAEALAIDPAHKKRVAFSTVFWAPVSGGKIFLSDDGGFTWDDVTGDLPDGTGAAAMAFSPDGKYLYAGRYAGSVYRLKLE